MAGLGGHDEKLDGIMVAAYSSGWTDDDVAPLFMDAVLLRQRYDGRRGLDFVAAGAPALDGSQACLSGKWPCRMQGPGHSVLWRPGSRILGTTVDPCLHLAFGAGTFSASFAARVEAINVDAAEDKSCGSNAARTCPRDGHFGWRLRWFVLGMVLWVHPGLVKGAPLACGDEEASSSQPRMNALNAVEVVTTARVRDWRRQHFMENDEDFAYAFASYDQAMLAGGHGLATEWLEVRARQEENLIPAAAAVVEALKPGRSSTVVPSAPRPVTQPLARSRRRGLRLHENTSSSPQAVTRRVEVLSGELMALGALLPTGGLTARLRGEWEQSVARLSQQLVVQAESITITNAVKTSQELRGHLRERGRSGYPEFLDLDSFIHSRQATMAPCRALNSLKWLSRNAHLNWDVQGLTAPTANRKKEVKSQQAIVVAPPMLSFLEEHVERLHRMGDARWTALLSSWLMAVGCLRHKHLTRTHPRRLSRSTLHCTCTKGKQRRLRQGFHFCVPGIFTTGWPWAEKWMDAYNGLPEDARRSAGMCFDNKGVAWAINEVTLIAREVFHGHVDNVEWLTTYSWRRWASTVAHTLQLSASEGAALGDWQNQKDLPEEARMPLHYSGARYNQSQRVKHLVLAVARHLAGFESWEMVTEEAASQARGLGKQAVDRALQQEGCLELAHHPRGGS